MTLFKKKAFSLIELSIALLIISIILGSIFKGFQLVEHAKLQSVAKQFQEIRMNIENYITCHGEFPGNKNEYHSLDDTKLIIEKMHEKGIVKSNHCFKSKFGGVFKVKTLNNKHYVQLTSQTGNSLLTPQQTEKLKSFFSFDSDSAYCMDGDIFSYSLSE